MISNRIRKAIQISVFAAGAALAGGAVQAAAYTGTWDPSYGKPFPNLDWEGIAKFYIPDSCLSQSGWISSADCSGMKITSGEVMLYDMTASSKKLVTSWKFEENSTSFVTQMEVTNHNLTGIRGGFLMPWKPNLSSLNYGTDTYFWLAFDGGPAMFHVTCADGGAVTNLKTAVQDFEFQSGKNGNGWANSNYDGQCGKAKSWGWNDNNQAGKDAGPGPLLWTAKGNTFTNDAGTINIPEPASLALVLSALGAGWAARRRRSS